jgi:hypothetical protein
MCERLKSVAVFGRNQAEIASIIDKKLDAVELVASMEIDQKPSRRPFRCRRKQAHMQDFVRLGSTVPYSQKSWQCRRIAFPSTASWSAVTVEIRCRPALRTRSWMAT